MKNPCLLLLLLLFGSTMIAVAVQFMKVCTNERRTRTYYRTRRARYNAATRIENTSPVPSSSADPANRTTAIIGEVTFCNNTPFIGGGGGGDSGIDRHNERKRSAMYTASKEIEGWSGELTFDAVAIISSAQRTRNVFSRSVGELGVHQGKSFVWIDAVSFAYERVFAFDVFDLQQYNTDHSGGAGLTLDSFWRNVEPVIGDRAHVEIIRGSSLTATACNFTKRNLAPVRLFSIDGSHTGEATYSDCCLAASVLSRGGCMFVDDYLNPGWLGVHEGVHRFLYEQRARFAPLAVIAGKFWICDATFVEFYRQTLIRELPSAIQRRGPELKRAMKLIVQSRMYNIQMVFVEGS